MLKKGDIILAITIVVIIIVSFIGINNYKEASQNESNIAVIKLDNKILRKINLNNVIEPQTIKLSEKFEEIILVESGRIRFLDANCPDQVCVKTGWLTRKGDIAVCLPNRASIKIEGTNEKVDGVTF